MFSMRSSKDIKQNDKNTKSSKGLMYNSVVEHMPNICKVLGLIRSTPHERGPAARTRVTEAFKVHTLGKIMPLLP